MAKFRDERIRAMILGRRSVREIPFPGADGVTVGVRLLTETEIDKAKLRAVQLCKQANADLDADPDFLERHVQRQVVWAAFVDPEDNSDDPQRFFADDTEIAGLDSVTVERLWQSYVDHQEWISPAITLDSEALDGLIEALGKEQGLDVALRLFRRDTLEACVRSLVSRLRAI